MRPEAGLRDIHLKDLQSMLLSRRAVETFSSREVRGDLLVREEDDGRVGHLHVQFSYE